MIKKEEFYKDLVLKALNTALDAMTRNRTLLFTLNIICVAVLFTIYLERFSLDSFQRNNYLIALRYFHTQYEKLGVPKDLIFQNNPDSIENWLFNEVEWMPDISIEEKIKNDITLNEKVQDSLIKEGEKQELSKYSKISTLLFRHKRLQNDIGSQKLPDDQNLPIGIPLPRNEIPLMSGLFLLTIYAWLLFSFRQLATVIEKLRKMLTNEKEKEFSEATIAFRDIIELHFLFKTSKKGITKHLVLGLYYAPPITLSLALVNHLYSYFSMGEGVWRDLLFSQVFLARFTVLFIEFIVLVWIAWKIRIADKAINLSAYGAVEVNDVIVETNIPDKDNQITA